MLKRWGFPEKAVYAHLIERSLITEGSASRCTFRKSRKCWDTVDVGTLVG